MKISVHIPECILSISPPLSTGINLIGQALFYGVRIGTCMHAHSKKGIVMLTSWLLFEFSKMSEHSQERC